MLNLALEGGRYSDLKRGIAKVKGAFIFLFFSFFSFIVLLFVFCSADIFKEGHDQTLPILSGEDNQCRLEPDTDEAIEKRPVGGRLSLLRKRFARVHD